MPSDPYTDFTHRQAARVDRTRELGHFRRRLRWWAITVAVATVVFAILLVLGDLT